MNLKTFLISGMLLLLINSVNAQTTPVKIIDIAVIPAINIDTLTGNPIISDTTELFIQFKIKNVQDASKAYIYFGTAQDTDDILSVQGDFIYQAGKYYLQINGADYEVKGYAAECKIKISKPQYDSYNYVTLFVEDISGQETDRLYFQK